jgi:hypothetical protein
MKEKVQELEEMLYNNRLTSFQAAQILLDLYFSKSGK